MYIFLPCFNRRVSSLGGGLHVDEGSSQVGSGGRGRLSAQSVSPDWSDCRNGGHPHQQRYSKPPPYPDAARPWIKDNTFYHTTISTSARITYGLIPVSYYMLTYNSSPAVASNRGRDVKPALSYYSVCHPKLLREVLVVFQIKLDRDDE